MLFINEEIKIHRVDWNNLKEVGDLNAVICVRIGGFTQITAEPGSLCF